MALLSMLCLTALPAFGQSAIDRGECPWRLPFRFSATVDGMYTYSKQIDSGFGYGCYDPGVPETNGESQFWIDAVIDTFPAVQTKDTTHNASMTISNDTLWYRSLWDVTTPGFTHDYNYHDVYLRIAFVPGTDQIASFQYHVSTSGSEDDYHCLLGTDTTLSLFGLHYTDSTITLGQVTNSDTASYRGFVNDVGMYRMQWGIRNMSDLSFYAHMAASRSLVKDEGPTAQRLKIVSQEDVLFCSCRAAESERDLELFSPLGVRLWSVHIPAGESTARIPKPMSGLYFLRLGDAVSKIAVTTE